MCRIGRYELGVDAWLGFIVEKYFYDLQESCLRGVGLITKWNNLPASRR
jgi:hypothetical protein